MKHPSMSNARDLEERSKKECVCGGHNISNFKSNPKHNSTKSKLEIKEARKFKRGLHVRTR